jgi:hypothetical protein
VMSLWAVSHVQVEWNSVSETTTIITIIVIIRNWYSGQCYYGLHSYVQLLPWDPVFLFTSRPVGAECVESHILPPYFTVDKLSSTLFRCPSFLFLPWAITWPAGTCWWLGTTIGFDQCWNRYEATTSHFSLVLIAPCNQ